MTRPRLLLAVMTLLLSVTLSVYAEPRLPNILLLVAEDLSPRVGAFGDEVAYTPNIDQLATQGTRFTQVFTTAGVCAPSRAALITGIHQQSFGAQHMRSSTGPLGLYYAQPAAEVRAFPELLRAKGYFTFTDRKLDYQFSGSSAGTGPFTLWDQENAEDYAWRNRQPGQPFFGLINFLETHESGIMMPTGPPHSPTHAATQKWRAKAGMVAPKKTHPDAVELPPYYPDLPEIRSDLARHYDNIAQMDARVGRILKTLLADGLARNTVVIWTTDHGDGLPRAKRELFDSGIHVPMIVRMPRTLAAFYAHAQLQPNSLNHTLISFVDIAPTLLGLAQIKPPAYLHGQPFLPARSAPRPTVPRRYIFAARDRIDEIPDRQRAVRDNRYKYIRSWYPHTPGGHTLAYRDNLDMTRAWRAAWRAQSLSPVQRRWFEAVGEEQLYDTRTDPYEINNLANNPKYAVELNRLQEALDAFMEQYPDTSEISENELRNSFLSANQIPRTPPPSIRQANGKLHLASDVGASIGYRYENRPWQLYTTPIDVRAIEAKAVRYGWQESEVTTTPSSLKAAVSNQN